MIGRFVSTFLVLLALSACRQALVVVLPNEDGSVGAVTFDDGKNKATLDKPFAAAEVRVGSESPTNVEKSEITDIFAAVFAARPILPKHFRFYCRLNSSSLTLASEADYMGLYQDLKGRPVYEIEIVGHADTLGEDNYDVDLSLERAEALRDRLVAEGFDARAITIAWRGYHDLLVPTPPHTPEPRNRRVEITVR